MDTTTIQARIDAMPAKMSAKGLRQPGVDFSLKANAGATIMLHWVLSDDIYQPPKYQFFYVNNSDNGVALYEAELWIANLPSIEETRFNEFASQLAKAIELGKQNGIEVDFVNPLVETMKKLSTNALMHRKPDEVA